MAPRDGTLRGRVRRGRGSEPRARARNPRASYVDVRDDTPIFDPLTKEQVAEAADGCVVLAAEEMAPADAVFVDGVGWSQDAPSVESREWDRAAAAERAAAAAYERAGIARQTSIAEVDDTYAYKQLQHLDALGLGDATLDPEHVNRAAARSARVTCAKERAGEPCPRIERLRDGDARVGVAQSGAGFPRPRRPWR